ncbi:MAG: MarR family transcriptional regulator [Gammaproteobacteria bacterium]
MSPFSKIDTSGANLDLQSVHYLQVFMGEVLRKLAEHFKGETTINHLRIGNYLGIRCLFEGKPTTNKDISAALGIPPSTVSRVTTEFLQRGYIVETPHPDDGRVRLITHAPGHPLVLGFEADLRLLVNDLLRRHSANQVVPVQEFDPHTTRIME